MSINRITVPVPAVPPRPPGLNLVTSSIQPEDTTDGRWTGGFTYAPENQYPGVSREVCDYTTKDDSADSGPGSYGNLPIVTCYPWLVVVEDSCSSFGFEARDFIGRATRLCDNATPNAIEAEFWTGALAQAAGNGNNYLTNPASVINLTPGGTSSSPGHTDGTPCSITRGVQILEDALASTGFGGQGMIHTMPETAPNFLGARRVGAQLLSVMDNIIIPGSGYPGTGPGGAAPASGGHAWIYATDLVQVRLDKIQVFPDNLQEALDRGQHSSAQPNRITFRAERIVAATFDVYRHFACQVTLST
jgi:hypothetical protein